MCPDLGQDKAREAAQRAWDATGCTHEFPEDMRISFFNGFFAALARAEAAEARLLALTGMLRWIESRDYYPPEAAVCLEAVQAAARRALEESER